VNGKGRGFDLVNGVDPSGFGNCPRVRVGWELGFNFMVSIFILVFKMAGLGY
jgi:hypothetical protein